MDTMALSYVLPSSIPAAKGMYSTPPPPPVDAISTPKGDNQDAGCNPPEYHTLRSGSGDKPAIAKNSFDPKTGRPLEILTSIGKPAATESSSPLVSNTEKADFIATAQLNLISELIQRSPNWVRFVLSSRNRADQTAERSSLLNMVLPSDSPVSGNTLRRQYKL